LPLFAVKAGRGADVRRTCVSLTVCPFDQVDSFFVMGEPIAEQASDLGQELGVLVEF
jgi:hypothetical protein